MNDQISFPGLSHNPNASAAQLDNELECNPDNPVDVEAVARHRNTSEKTLRGLATHTDPNVVNSVAGNESTPPDLLLDLASDPRQFVREGLAGNRKAPVPALEKLHKDPSPSVRGALALNPAAVQGDLLSKLEKDDDPNVRGNARFTQEALRRYGEWVSKQGGREILPDERETCFANIRQSLREEGPESTLASVV